MKKIILISLVAISLTSCLKDARRIDFASGGNIVNMPLSGLANFAADAIIPSPDTVKFAVSYATAQSNKAITVTLGVDTTLIAAYNTANPGITYYSLPTTAYTFTSTKINIAAGAQYAFTSIIFDKTTLDAAKSYMLPVVIKDAQGVSISANSKVHYFHIIGNDFAGSWTQNFQRYNAADSTSAALHPQSFTGHTATFAPVSPTEFTTLTGYAGGVYTYDVTFTKALVGGVPMYSNFTVSITPASLAASGIALTQPPVFLNPPFNLATPLTFAQASKIFHFQYIATPAVAPRYLIDTYHR